MGIGKSRPYVCDDMKEATEALLKCCPADGSGSTMYEAASKSSSEGWGWKRIALICSRLAALNRARERHSEALLSEGLHSRVMKTMSSPFRRNYNDDLCCEEDKRACEAVDQAKLAIQRLLSPRGIKSKECSCGGCSG